MGKSVTIQQEGSVEHDSFWSDLQVAVSHDPALLEYPRAEDAPFDPDRSYPEYEDAIAGRPNPVYAAVRHLLWLLGRDQAHFGTRHWNPLREIIEPGMRV